MDEEEDLTPILGTLMRVGPLFQAIADDMKEKIPDAQGHIILISMLAAHLCDNSNFTPADIHATIDLVQRLRSLGAAARENRSKSS